MMEEKPLITFLLICYNQEKYIREALQGAFSQTYSPLEIVISDDASTDRTFEIIEEERKKYRGPHAIKLNKNRKNMGIGGNVNAAMAMSEGDLIVAAAGDDISLPKRVEKIFSYWDSLGRTPMSIFTAAHEIDEYGAKYGEYHSNLRVIEDPVRYKKERVSVLGASHAWHREAFDAFGPMMDGIASEDVVIPFRSVLIGGLHYFDEILVAHRVGSGYSANKVSKNILTVYRKSVIQNIEDAKLLACNNDKLYKVLRDALESYNLYIRYKDGEYFSAIIAGVRSGLSIGSIIYATIRYIVNISDIKLIKETKQVLKGANFFSK